MTKIKRNGMPQKEQTRAGKATKADDTLEKSGTRVAEKEGLFGRDTRPLRALEARSSASDYWIESRTLCTGPWHRMRNKPLRGEAEGASRGGEKVAKGLCCCRA